MRIHKLDSMVRGWFVGAFNPTAHHTDAAEVAVKSYAAGQHEEAHFHKVATEITLILSGTAIMAGQRLSAGDIVVISPNEAADFTAETDVTTVVVKVPGALNDKFAVQA